MAFYLTILTVLLVSITQIQASTTIPQRTLQYIVLRAEFHAHTTFSDGNCTPTELVDRYVLNGYDVLAFTDHNNASAYDQAKPYADMKGLIVIRGEELSYNWPDGEHKHVLGLFLTQTIPINKSWSLNNLIQPICDAVHAQGGIAIISHPWRGTNYIHQSYQAAWIDGYEVAFSNWNETVTARRWIAANRIVILNHDNHQSPDGTLQASWTYVLSVNRTEEGVLDALLSHRTLAFTCEPLREETWQIMGNKETIDLFLDSYTQFR